MTDKPKQPKKWKMAIIAWIAIYPTVTIIFALFGEYLAQIKPMPLRTLLITAIVVPIMIFFLMPPMQKILRNWLTK